MVDFEVIVVDDGSVEGPVIPEGLEFPITIIKMENKVWTNPEPAYNAGIRQALENKTDIIMLQNPECYHAGDVLQYAQENTRAGNYLTFACFSLSEENTMAGELSLNYERARYDGHNAWYNHSVHRPVAYEFCAAITAENMKRLNGYDERLAFGWGRGDAYLLHRIRLMGLDVEIIDAPFVVHQWHYNNVPENRPQLIKKNRRIFEQLVKENTYIAKHLITA